MHWLPMDPKKEVSATEASRGVSNVNFVEWVAPGGFRRLRGSWDLVNFVEWSRSAHSRVCSPDEFRVGMNWWRHALNRGPSD